MTKKLLCPRCGKKKEDADDAVCDVCDEEILVNHGIDTSPKDDI